MCPACSVLKPDAQIQNYRLLNHSLGGLSGAFLLATTSTTFLLAPGCRSASTNTSATCALQHSHRLPARKASADPTSNMLTPHARHSAVRGSCILPATTTTTTYSTQHTIMLEC